MTGGKSGRSARTTNKRLAKKILNIRLAEIVEGRFNLVSTRPPTLGEWGEQFLETVAHPPTKRVYTSNLRSLKEFFGADTRLSHITARRIEEYKRKRLGPKTGPAIVNRDLALLRTMLNRAARQKHIGRNPFVDVDFLDERKVRRQPHILTFEEQEKLLPVAPPRLRALIVLITETGLRVKREALALSWKDVDFSNEVIHVRESKTPAGRRTVPMSKLCKAEMLRWKNLLGPDFSPFVFPQMSSTRHPLQGGRKAWVSALKKAEIPYFPIYNLRHTFASRLNQAGASPITVAQMLGHSSAGIVQTYARVLDDARREAIRRLEAHRASCKPTNQDTPRTGDSRPTN